MNPATPLALGTSLLWLTLRLVYRSLPRRTQATHLVAIGAIAGFAFWTNWLILPYFVVAGVYEDPLVRPEHVNGAVR